MSFVIKKVKAKRFLSIGDEGVEIDFTTLGPIVNIIGKNQDYGENASNGSGKSTCMEMITYALYGKLMKGLNHKKASHIYSKKGLELEIEVDNLRIVRKRNPEILQLFEDGKEIMSGGLTATQEEINSKLKLNYEGFVNVACFGQHSFHGFLQCEAKEKREIAENLLGLDYYARYHEVAKKQKAYITDSIKDLKLKYESIVENIRRGTNKIISLKSQQSQWLNSKNNDLTNTESQLKILEYELNDSSNDKFIQASKRIDEINLICEKKEYKINQFKDALSDALKRADSLRNDRDQVSMEIASMEGRLREANRILKKRREEIDSVEKKQGSKCVTCHGVVRAENIPLMTQSMREEFERAIKEVETLTTSIEPSRFSLEDIMKKYDKLSGICRKAREEETRIASELRDLINEKMSLSQIKPATQREIELKSKIESTIERIVHIKNEMDKDDPFKKLIEITESENQEFSKELDGIKQDLDQKEKLLPYYEYWVKGYGDKGIRSYLLEERLPALNRRLNFWLQILIDNKLRINFDRDLNETIRRVPDDSREFVYNCLSGGELSRIDLSISHAFAHITMMSSKACPSIISLDEVGTNFDRPGIVAVYKMICELAKERQVLVVTHDVDLLDMLKNCDTIIAKMKNGVTKLEINRK